MPNGAVQSCTVVSRATLARTSPSGEIGCDMTLAEWVGLCDLASSITMRYVLVERLAGYVGEPEAQHY